MDYSETVNDVESLILKWQDSSGAPATPHCNSLSASLVSLTDISVKSTDVMIAPFDEIHLNQCPAPHPISKTFFPAKFLSL